MTDSLTIRREDLDSPVARRLIDALNVELDAKYPEPGANFFALTSGVLLVAYLGSDAVACGAVRCIEAGVAEIKRMYVSPAFRGRGIARLMLAALEENARELGMRCLVLETGERQPHAIALYRDAGFVTIPCFGEYIGSPLSVCMGKDLN